MGNIKIMQKLSRITFDIAIILSILLLPWVFPLTLIAVGLILIDAWIEGLMLFALFVSINSFGRLEKIHLLWYLGFIITYFAISIIKDKMRR